MTDPIADMLTRIRNAIAAKHSRADIPASKLKLEIARILKEEGYINNFVLKGEGLKRSIRIFFATMRAARRRSRTSSASRDRGAVCMWVRVRFPKCSGVTE
jgi:ribosomal protein S8